MIVFSLARTRRSIPLKSFNNAPNDLNRRAGLSLSPIMYRAREGMTETQGDATDRRTVTRRGFLGGVAAVGLLGSAAPASAQEGTETGTGTTGTPTTEYQLGAQVTGWSGQKPGSIEGTENPTLRLEAGRTYAITWVNLDGQQHQLQVLDADGEPVAESDLVSTQGATGAVEFEAGPGTVAYSCSIHTTSMEGRIRVARGAAATETSSADPGTGTAEATTPTTTEPTPTPATAGTTGTADGGTTTGSNTDDELSPVETPAPGGQPGFGVAAGAAAFLAAGLARLVGGD